MRAYNFAYLGRFIAHTHKHTHTVMEWQKVLLRPAFYLPRPQEQQQTASSLYRLRISHTYIAYGESYL